MVQRRHQDLFLPCLLRLGQHPKLLQEFECPLELQSGRHRGVLVGATHGEKALVLEHGEVCALDEWGRIDKLPVLRDLVAAGLEAGLGSWIGNGFGHRLMLSVKQVVVATLLSDTPL